MATPRYQIFVSSTFRDLQDERQGVLEAILQLNHFPAGMEIFPAADSTPWDLIEKVIGESDYYVLIIGGRYGSTDESGIGYTEREYDLAVQLGIPVLAFLHGDPDQIPQGKIELSKAARRKLEAFRAKVQGKHCTYWTSTDELRLKVVYALTAAFQTKPRVGWVRADGVDNTELMKRLLDLQERYDEAVAERDALRRRVEEDGPSVDIAHGADPVSLPFTVHIEKGKAHADTVSTTWDQLFFGLARSMLSGANLRRIRIGIASAAYRSFRETDLFREKCSEITSKRHPGQFFSVSEEFARRVLNQFAALKLVEPDVVRWAESSITSAYMVGAPRTAAETLWTLTEKGKAKYFAHVAHRRSEGGSTPENEEDDDEIEDVL